MRTAPGTLLGGALHYEQPVEGYRTGIEPVLLAAAIPARPGQRVLEAGTGVGAGLMCLAARMAGVACMGVEIDPEMAALARRNIAANGLPGLHVLTVDLLAADLSGFDHAFANPPWHAPGSTRSPVPRRALAKQARAGLLEAWAAALLRAIAPGGTVTLVLRAEDAGRARAAMPGTTIVSLLPKAGRPAKLVLARAVRGAVAAPADADPIVLHEADGRYAGPIEAVLRDGRALALAGL